MPFTSTSDNLDTTIVSRERIAEISLTDPDDPTSIFGMNVLTATDDRFEFVYTNRYEPVAGQNTYRHFYDLYAVAGAAFDHETESMIVFTIYANSHPDIQENDRYPYNSVSTTFTLTVADVNERPTDITLEGAVDNEITKTTSNNAGGIKIGQLGGVDPDAVDDVNGEDPDNQFGEFEFILDKTSAYDPDMPDIEIRTDVNGDSFAYLSKTASELRYVNYLVARIEIKDNPGADESERLSHSEDFAINLDHPLTIDVTSSSVSVKEDDQLIFGQAHGNAISVYGLDGEATTVTISVSSGKLSTGGQTITYEDDQGVERSFATASVYNSAEDEHQLTFTNIDEHDLTALLEGLVYIPNADSNGNDKLKIDITKGAEIKEASIAITIESVDPVNEAPRIIGFGDVVKYQDNVNNFVFKASVNSDYTISRTAQTEDIAAIGLSATDSVTIEDDDGYTVANGKLYFRVIESATRKTVAPYDEYKDYIKLRTSLPAGEAGVYLDGMNLKYRSATTADVTIGNLAKHEHTGSQEYGYFLVEYIFAFSSKPASFVGTEGDWEDVLKDALVNLLNVVETDPTSDPNKTDVAGELDGSISGEDASTRKLVNIYQKTLVTVQFEDVKAQAKSDQEGVLVINDQTFEALRETSDVLTGIITQTLVKPDTYDYPPPSKNVDAIITYNIIDAMVTKDAQGNNAAWKDTETHLDKTSDDLLQISYYFADEDSDIATLKTIIENSPVDIGKITTSLLRDEIEDALEKIEKVAKIKFTEYTGAFNRSEVELVFSLIEPLLNGPDDIAGITDIVTEATSARRLGWIGVEEGAGQLIILHEILHALGLRHPGLQYGNEDAPFLPSDQAIFSNTVMAYTNKYGLQPQEDNALPNQPQLYDIDALGVLYGLNEATEDNDYDFTSKIGAYETIYDRGGIDTLNFNGDIYSQGITLDLTPGTRSYFKKSNDQNTLVDVNFLVVDESDLENFSDNNDLENVDLENVIGSPADDHIYGNDANNQLEGEAGADLLDGRGGMDTVSYKLSDAGVNVDLSKKKQAVSTDKDDHSSGDILINIEHIIGSKQNDVLKGNRDHNRIEGGKGDDTLTGDGGKDIFVVRFALDTSEPERDTITDFQSGVDKIKIQTTDTMLDLEAAFNAEQIGIKKTGAHTLELYLASNEDHAVAVTFVDAIDLANAIDFDGFTGMLLGDEDEMNIGNHFELV